MKYKIITLLVLTSMLVSVTSSAQTFLRLGVGTGSSNLKLSQLRNNNIKLVNGNTVEMTKLKTTYTANAYINLNSNRTSDSKLKTGINIALRQQESNWRGFLNNSTAKGTHTDIIIAPEGQFYWQGGDTDDKFNIYTGIALGAAFSKLSLTPKEMDGEKTSFTKITAHISVLGFSFGGKIKGFVELGVGFKGYINGGIQLGL
jgi:hypothetical protein